MNNKIVDLINSAQKILVIQADNPDGDSLASSLALEAILSQQGKQVIMYCGVDVPSYLKHFPGWDRVVASIPSEFDLSIIVDTSSISLLEAMAKNDELKWLKSKPCIVIDHHTNENTIDFTTVSLIKTAVSTGELIYDLAIDNDWEIPEDAATFIASSILYDSLGLTSESVTPKILHNMADLVERGVCLAGIEDNRRKSNKKSLRIARYKGELLQRIELDDSGQIAFVVIPWEEIERYSYEYNPSILVLDEMRMVEGVKIAIAFKTYPDGKITAKIRANFGFDIADKLAENFGGGGHPYASGFKVISGKTIDEIKQQTMAKANELLK